MRVIKTTYHERMASGNSWCAHGELSGRQTTAWGKTEAEAESNLESKLNNVRKK